PRRLGVALAAAALAAAATAAAAGATAKHDALLVRRGVTHALAEQWVKPADAQRYRKDVAVAVRESSVLPRLRAAVIASQLAQLAAVWDSYTSPRALALFTQLEQNLAYLKTPPLPPHRIDVTDKARVVHPAFAGLRP